MVLVRLIQDKNQETTSAIFYCFDGLFWRIAETSYRNIALNANHLEDDKLTQLRKTKRLDDYILSSICNLLEQEENKDIINDIGRCQHSFQKYYKKIFPKLLIFDWLKTGTGFSQF